METQIEKAIFDATEAYGQPPEVATKIVAWLRALKEGSENIDESSSAMQRAGILYEAAQVTNEEE